MGRKLRSYFPGAFFHLIARTQSRIHWFDDDVIKRRVVDIIADAVEATDVELNAFVVMNNHFHLLASQGSRPLSAFMQPVMRRIALLLRAHLGLEDHVFGARYWDRPCSDGADLRECIRYIHRNPLRAGVCADPGDYPWSSHVAYARVIQNRQWRPRLAVLRSIFATRSCSSEADLCAEYLRFVSADEPAAATSRRGSHFDVGDAIAREMIASNQRQLSEKLPRKRVDLRDIIDAGIAELCPDLDIEMVRTFRGVWISRVRAALVQRAARAGYKGCQIAQYLHLSESRVSRIVRAMPVFERPR